jgi:hypothetical protein
MALTEARAWACLLTNVLVLPGAGTMAAGRRTVGLVQAVLALAGFVMVCAWMIFWISEATEAAALPSGLGGHGGLGVVGLILAVVSWAWALVSSLDVLREAKAASPATRPPGAC